MIIPSFSKNQNDDFYNEQLSKALQNGLSNNGWTSPNQTTANIVTLSNTMPSGTFWTNTDTNQIVFKMPDNNLYSVDMTPFTP